MKGSWGSELARRDRSPRGGRSGRLVAAVSAAVVLAAGATACGSSNKSSNSGNSASGGTTKGGYKIGVAMKTQLQRRWQFDVRAMQDEAKKLGDTLVIQWANDDPNRQASQVENLLSQGVNALIDVPVDDTAAAAQANAAHQQKVPIVSYDIGIQGAPVDFFVERNNQQAGRLQAQAALKAKPTGNYALLKGDAAISVSRIMTNQWLSALKGKSSVKVVFNQWVKNFDPGTAQSLAEDALSRNNDNIDAFLSLNDGMATGIGQALKGRGLAGKVFLSGLDADPANLRQIADGTQTMTVWTPVDEEGRAAVRAAHDLAAGRKPKAQITVPNGAGNVPTQLIPVSEINKANLCDFVNGKLPAGWATAKQLFPGKPDACKK